jgi:hypothetical protein
MPAATRPRFRRSGVAPLDPDRVLSIPGKLNPEARLGPALVAAVVALIS